MRKSFFKQPSLQFLPDYYYIPSTIGTTYFKQFIKLSLFESNTKSNNCQFVLNWIEIKEAVYSWPTLNSLSMLILFLPIRRRRLKPIQSVTRINLNNIYLNILIPVIQGAILKAIKQSALQSSHHHKVTPPGFLICFILFYNNRD